ncbi:transporter substrate-binding domain-containing protein [Massilia sp. PAMC28688]|uniref:substrate-binding periplasmic protein n=1 Tax=Massilia sp. PAMC28688 TaxID=2861283 RepID=UPI001C635E94|nr:transporter substrate-binding domain-containing protein [Massilia sp. PAMC28688]QYF94927.1 transporter substrate-binding domain-containing protein [Massilia sp. PAMC28688]
MLVGVRGGFPLASVEASGDKSGLYVEVLEAIAAHADTSFDVQLLPFPRLRQYLKEGRLTAVLAVPNNAMLADSVAVGDVMEFDVVAVGRRGTRVRTLEELRGKKICLTRGSSLVPELYADKRFLLKEVSNHDSCPKMLDAGRVDFIISLPIGLAHLLPRMGKTPADFGEPYLIKRVPVQLLVSRWHANQTTVQTLRMALERAKGAGSIASIQSRYEKAAQ